MPVIWPSGEAEEDTALFLEQYGEYRDALDAPFLKERLLGSQWRGWVEGYAHLAIGRLAFLRMRRDHPEATNIWQLAQVTLDYLRQEMPGVDDGYLSIFFPDADTLWRRVVVNPLSAVVYALGENKVAVDIYGHPGLENTDDSVDVMLTNVSTVQPGRSGNGFIVARHFHLTYSPNKPFQRTRATKQHGFFGASLKASVYIETSVFSYLALYEIEWV